MKFEIAKEIFELIPNACFGVVAVKGIDNGGRSEAIEDLLAENIAACEKDYEGVKVKNADEIAPYREAFRAIGINPNRYQCSIEALLDRISKGKGFPHINKIVDLGNAVSLKYRLPIGAHDMGTVEDKLEVRYARSGDLFIPFGGGEAEIPEEKEIVYVSGSQVRTRRWTWRQSEIGKITEASTDILFPIDGFSDVNQAKVEAAAEELAEALSAYFGVKADAGLIDQSSRVFETV